MVKWMIPSRAKLCVHKCNSHFDFIDYALRPHTTARPRRKLNVPML